MMSKLSTYKIYHVYSDSHHPQITHKLLATASPTAKYVPANNLS